MMVGFYEYVEDFEDCMDVGICRVVVMLYELFFYDEGFLIVVIVGCECENGNVWFVNNGKIDVLSQGDMVMQLFVVYLFFVFVFEVKDVFVIGLVSGILVGVVMLYEMLECIDFIEIELVIVEVSYLFVEFNNQLFDDLCVNLIVNDGCNQLFVMLLGIYDFVLVQFLNFWFIGVVNFFIKEFFELGCFCLVFGGIWVQWIQIYGMVMEDLCFFFGVFFDVFFLV